jgi:hypothetical protein
MAARISTREVTMKPLEQLKAEALELDLQARAELAKALLESLEEPAAEEHERLWMDEAERRQREVAEGEVALVAGPEVMKRLAGIG